MTETTSQKHKNPTHKKREGGRKMKRLVIAVVTAVLFVSAGASMAFTGTDPHTVPGNCIDVCMISSTQDVDLARMIQQTLFLIPTVRAASPSSAQKAQAMGSL